MTDSEIQKASDTIIDALPADSADAAQVALAVAAAKCIDAGMTDEQAGRGLMAALIGFRNRLRRARAN